MAPQWSLTFEVRKRLGHATFWMTMRKPQWSLTFEVRKRCDKEMQAIVLLHAAMEPDL